LKEKTLPSWIEDIFEWVESAVISMFVVVLLFTFVFGVVRVDGESMTETLQHRDMLIISHLNYEPQKGDIVIISRNYDNNEQTVSSEPIVKRVIATEGDEIDIKDGDVYINGVKQNESYAKGRTYPCSVTGVINYPVTVKEGTVFVMGDNREDSHDSRFDDIFLVDERYILGKAIFRIFPFNSITKF
jgi:signal peptidase I